MARVLERAPHDGGAHDGPAVVRERDRARALEGCELGQPLALLAHGDRGERVDPAARGGRGPRLHPLDRRGTVHRRAGVGHARDRRETAGGRGGGPGRDRLLGFAAGLAQVDVEVHQARREDGAAGIDDARRLAGALRAHDRAALEGEIEPGPAAPVARVLDPRDQARASATAAAQRASTAQRTATPFAT